MTIVIVLSLFAGAVLSLYFNAIALVWASAAALFLTGVGEIANASSVGFAVLLAIVSVFALQAGYLGGALVQHVCLSPESKSAKEGEATIRSRI